MSVAHYTANSLAEFVEQICKIKNSLRQNGAEFNEVSLFRGQADESYELLPSLARPIISESSESLIHEERNLIEMAKFRLPSIFQESMRPLERLALLQHYGVPTRLLDITENAFVALYFACCSCSKIIKRLFRQLRSNRACLPKCRQCRILCNSCRIS